MASDLEKIWRLAASGSEHLAEKNLLSNIKRGLRPVESKVMLMHLYSRMNKYPAVLDIGSSLLEKVFSKEAISILSQTYLRTNQHQAAANYFLKLYERYPNSEDALDVLVVALVNSNRTTEFLPLLDRLSPSNALRSSTQINLGNILVSLKRYDSALVFFRGAQKNSKTPSDLSSALNGQAVCLYELGHYVEVLQNFYEDQEIVDPSIANLVALSLRKLGRWSEAINLLESLEEKFSHSTIFQEQLAHFYTLLGRYADSLQLYQKISLGTPLSPVASRNLGHVLLRSKEFGEAFKILGKTLPGEGSPFRIQFTQGVGDAFLMSRFIIPWARRRRINELSLACDPRLVPVFGKRSCHDLKVEFETFDPQHDHRTSTTLFDVALECLQAPESGVGDSGLKGVTWFESDFLQSPPSQFRRNPGVLRVGIAWSSANRDLGFAKGFSVNWLLRVINRTLPKQRFQFLNLQYDSDEAACQVDGIGYTLELPGFDKKNHFPEMFGYLKTCDFIVSCSNSVVHMAGLLGIPTIMLLPRGDGSLWYWFEDEHQTPWYDSVTLIRQQTAGDWSTCVEEAHNVIGRVASQVIEKMTSPSPDLLV